MSIKYLPFHSLSDNESWNIYKNTKYRWIFNKLEISIRQGLHCGPAGVPPQKEGWYIHRPVYNLYGMGIGAQKIYYTLAMHKQFINHGVIPPGNFWCEWIPGDQLSMNYRKDIHGNWHLVSVWKGTLFSETNLTKFKQWEKVSPSLGININNLSEVADWLDDNTTTCFNIETKGGHIIEIHLRSGDEVEDQFNIGDILVPIWEDTKYHFKETVSEPDPEMTIFGAYGNLVSIRNGFGVLRKRGSVSQKIKPYQQF